MTLEKKPTIILIINIGEGRISQPFSTFIAQLNNYINFSNMPINKVLKN